MVSNLHCNLLRLIYRSFGSEDWQDSILNLQGTNERSEKIVELYRKKLHRWFRYVLPMPFKPKVNQLYHIFMCSNYERGVDITRGFYANYSQNQLYEPDNIRAYRNFARRHPDVFMGLERKKRPLQWKFLWAIMKYHEEGIADVMCEDLKLLEEDWRNRVDILDWLESKGYLRKKPPLSDIWNEYDSYELDWQNVKSSLNVDSPRPLIPKPPSSAAE